MQRIFGRRGVEFLNDIAADDLLLDRKALLRAVLRRGCGLARQGQLDASLGEHVVSGVDEVEDLGIPTYGTAWYTISLTSTGVTPTVNAAPSMTRYSRRAWEAIIDAS